MYMLLLARRCALEMNTAEDDEDDAGWEDMDDEGPSSSKPVKTIKKGTLRRPKKGSR